MPSEKDLKQLTANHLKRLFANQDVFTSLDRNVAGLTVSEADEKECKASDGGDETPATAPTPETMSEAASDAGLPCLDDDGVTPLAGIVLAQKNPFSEVPTPAEYESDSTISAPRTGPAKRLEVPEMDRLESSGVDDSDAHAFVSRLPRRSKPAPRYVPAPAV